MSKIQTAGEHYRFTVEETHCEQGCKSCGTLMGVGAACIRIDHEGGPSLLGTSEKMKCPRCREEILNKARFFASVPEAEKVCDDLTCRLRNGDETLIFRLQDYQVTEPSLATLQ
ncbi:MAG: hypothetical protein JWL82_151 [Parcubacteria group bacterium]|nr:hypothetical protein [Parcubacteria group bacterium]